MHMDDRFFEQAFRTVGDGLLRIVARANLHLKPMTLPKSLKRRCLADLRQLAVILRRLIFLMALGIELAPPRPGAGPDARRAAALPEGVEDVTASFGPQSKGFRLAPRMSGLFPDHLRTLSGPPPARSVSPRRLLAQWQALHAVLKDPEAHARRLARTLARWRRAGEPAPCRTSSARPPPRGMTQAESHSKLICFCRSARGVSGYRCFHPQRSPRLSPG